MYNVLKLNEISPVADHVFSDNYKLSKDCKNPDAIMLRSYNMHEYELNKELLCVARAGAGTNNIPIEKCSKAGIVVFNTPGANANAVKELVLCCLFLGSRHIIESIEWTKTLKNKGAEVAPLVEKGKSQFVGPEIIGKKLGIIGLGAIGAVVANSAAGLGMTVLGYDPYISVDSAWGLSRSVQKITDINTIFSECDYISIHVPYNKNHKDFINKNNIKLMKEGVVIINCSRGELINNEDIINAVNSKKVARYITDFPADELINVPNIICIPHLGASTPEAEDNCAIAAAAELVNFMENGVIKNSVNFPNCDMPRAGVCRITIIHLNIKTIISKITSAISAKNINIANFVDKSIDELAYSILDLDDKASDSLIKELEAIEGVVRLRVIK